MTKNPLLAPCCEEEYQYQGHFASVKKGILGVPSYFHMTSDQVPLKHSLDYNNPCAASILLPGLYLHDYLSPPKPP